MEPSVRRQFLREYAIIRSAEGRGSSGCEYYRALPDRDLSGRNPAQWRIRARSYRYFERRILKRIEKEAGRPLTVLDLGAGNGWMSYRLRERGHAAFAVDVFCDPLDGLAAARHFPISIPRVAAEFDILPVAGRAIDLIVFNSSFHYSSNYAVTLRECQRCLHPDGRVVIMDTPFYRSAQHGERMRQERRQFFEQTYGFRSDSLGSVEYLDEATLAALQRDLGLEVTRHHPWYGWQWALRPWRARLTGKRPPSRFMILVGRFL